ncbi:MAG: tryptophan synthase subunit alpha [Magnetococcales bacterium]|nr:tryptophan synthase subunit alpha [Magnetococcales bacterium]
MSADTLEAHITSRLAERATQTPPGSDPILLMSHLVLGHPSLEDNREVIRQMVANGVDIMELQIPFSEPIADGPVIARANQSALDGGFEVDQGLAFISEMTRTHAIPFLIMTYYNILLARGVAAFIQDAANRGVRGLIVPDLPLEEADEAIELCHQAGMDWIQLMTPTCPDERLAAIGSKARGFCYCVARKGVTGKDTAFGQELKIFMDRCRQAAGTPLALGFGVKKPEDVQFLSGLADIAVVGTKGIEINREQGAEGVGRFFKALRG